MSMNHYYPSASAVVGRRGSAVDIGPAKLIAVRLIIPVRALGGGCAISPEAHYVVPFVR